MGLQYSVSSCARDLTQRPLGVGAYEWPSINISTFVVRQPYSSGAEEYVSVTSMAGAAGTATCHLL